MKTACRSSRHIRILSYNIRHCEGNDGRIDLERTASVIRSASPDIVSLQEVDNRVRRSRKVDQSQELARLTGMTCVFGRSIDLEGGEYGNALLTTLPVKNSETIHLPGKEERSALSVTLQTSRSPASPHFAFIATHLDLTPEARTQSAEIINKVVTQQTELPAILAGDLNACPGSETIKVLEKCWCNAAGDGTFHTFPSICPECQIDHIFYRPFKGFEVLDFQVLEEAAASDHRPILTVLAHTHEDKEVVAT